MNKSIQATASNKLLNMKNINACKWRSMVETMSLFPSIKRCIHFRQLKQYGKHSQQRYPVRFKKSSDFPGFNSEGIYAGCFTGRNTKFGKSNLIHA